MHEHSGNKRHELATKGAVANTDETRERCNKLQEHVAVEMLPERGRSLKMPRSNNYTQVISSSELRDKNSTYVSNCQQPNGFIDATARYSFIGSKKQLTAKISLISFLICITLPEAVAQCPWRRDSVELHSDCICDFNPSHTTNLEGIQQHPVNRMSVQCSPVDFKQLLAALKQAASIELPQLLAQRILINQQDNLDEEEARQAGLQVASQAKLDLLHVSNSTISELESNSFILDTAKHLPSHAGGSSINHLVVAIQSLHLSRCGIRQIQSGAFNGLEWSLTSLSLSDNQLEYVPIEALRRLVNLRVLDLSNNKLVQVAANSFLTLNKLNTLRLADNRIGQQSQPFQAMTSIAMDQSPVSTPLVGKRNTSSSSIAQGIDLLAFQGLQMSLTDLNLKNTQLDEFPTAIRCLNQLAFLNLAQNQISHVPPKSFEGMNSLTAINLERNRIQRIEDDTFIGVERSLSSLSLLGNLLETFPSQQLSKLVAIRRLDIGFNGIEYLPDDAFAANRRLILIALDGNPLETLPEAAFKPLKGTLRGMSIGGKALNCDCRLSWMLRWQQEFNLQISSRERQPQFCAKPNYLRSLVSFSALKPEHLTCDQQLQFGHGTGMSQIAPAASSHKVTHQQPAATTLSHDYSNEVYTTPRLIKQTMAAISTTSNLVPSRTMQPGDLGLSNTTPNGPGPIPTVQPTQSQTDLLLEYQTSAKTSPVSPMSFPTEQMVGFERPASQPANSTTSGDMNSYEEQTTAASMTSPIAVFGDRTSLSAYFGTYGNSTTMTDQQQMTTNSLSANGSIGTLPDDELFVANDPQRLQNRQGFLPSIGNRIKNSPQELSSVQLRPRNRSSTTTHSPALDYIHEANSRENEAGKRLKPIQSIFGVRAASERNQQKRDHKRTNSNVTTIASVAPAQRSTLAVTSLTGATNTLSSTTISSHKSITGHPTLSQRHAGHSTMQLVKGARFVEESAREEPNPATINFQSITNPSTPAFAFSPSSAVSNANDKRTQLIDSSVEHLPLASSSAVISRASTVESPTPTPRPTTTEIAPTSESATTLRSFPNNTRMSVSSMYRLAFSAQPKPSTSTTTSTSTSATITTSTTTSSTTPSPMLTTKAAKLDSTTNETANKLKQSQQQVDLSTATRVTPTVRMVEPRAPVDAASSTTRMSSTSSATTKHPAVSTEASKSIGYGHVEPINVPPSVIEVTGLGGSLPQTPHTATSTGSPRSNQQRSIMQQDIPVKSSTVILTGAQQQHETRLTVGSTTDSAPHRRSSSAAHQLVPQSPTSPANAIIATLAANHETVAQHTAPAIITRDHPAEFQFEGHITDSIMHGVAKSSDHHLETSHRPAITSATTSATSANHHQVSPARIFGRLIKLADFDQLALILAGFLCFFILILALTIVCLCYSSRHLVARKNKRHKQRQPTSAATSTSRLSSFSSSSEQQPASGVNRSDEVLSPSATASALPALFCCFWPKRKGIAQNNKMITPMRSLIMQDDDNNSSGSSSQDCSKSTGNSMLLSANQSTGNGGGDHLFNTIKKASMRVAKRKQNHDIRAAGKSTARNDKAQQKSAYAFDNRAMEAENHQGTRHRLAMQQEYFMGVASTLHNGSHRVPGSNGHQMSEQGGEIMWTTPSRDGSLASSCDSDKSCSPGANRNNRYNISDAHRAYLIAGKNTEPIQASMFVTTSANSGQMVHKSGLLKTIETGGHDYFDRTSRLSSDKSTTDDSRTPLSGHQRTCQGQKQLSTLRTTRSFVAPIARSRSIGRVQDANHQRQQIMINQVTVSSGCNEYPSAELMPMSAEEQWPEPYVDPNDEDEAAIAASSEQSPAYLEHGDQFDNVQALNYQRSHNNNNKSTSSVTTKRQLIDGRVNQRIVPGHRRTGSSSTASQRNAYDDAYLVNWHTVSRGGAKRPPNEQLMDAGEFYQPIAASTGGPSTLVKYRSIPSLQQSQQLLNNSKPQLLANQVTGATNWLRYTPDSFNAQTANSSESRNWHRDNQVEAVYVANESGQQQNKQR